MENAGIIDPEQLLHISSSRIPAQSSCLHKGEKSEHLISHCIFRILKNSTSAVKWKIFCLFFFTVSRCYIEDSGEAFFLHAARADSDGQVGVNHTSHHMLYFIILVTCNVTQVFTTCQSRDYRWQQGHTDSYAQHSVAPKIQLPPAAPSRLQVESDPEDTIHPPLTDSYTSSPDTQGRRFMKRKVLR